MKQDFLTSLSIHTGEQLEPDKKQLRHFGLLVGSLFVVIFSFALPIYFVYSKPVWPLLIALPLFGLGILSPIRLRSVFLIWMLLGGWIGGVVSRVILTLLFILLITPIGVLNRIFGGDPLKLKFDPSTASYKEIVDEAKVFDFKRPF